MIRRALSAVLLSLVLTLATARAKDYHPAPGSNAETWFFQQVLHKMRHKRAVVAGLHWLKGQKPYAADFADVTYDEAEADSEYHDYTKIHQEPEFLHAQGLPEDDFIPEEFGQFEHDHVRPAPEGSHPKDPAHPTPPESFRIWVDRLNGSDDSIVERTRRRFTPEKREKIAFLTHFADFADTGNMRRKEFSSAETSSHFIQRKINEHWKRLDEIGPRQDLLLKMLKHFETPVGPGVDLYQEMMADLSEEVMLPRFRKDGACLTCLTPRNPLPPK
jgi:hypothetical protein